MTALSQDAVWSPHKKQASYSYALGVNSCPLWQDCGHFVSHALTLSLKWGSVYM